MLKVSIIIPVFRVEKYIERCVRSIFEQSYSNLEIIFVDDCSPDNSVQIIRELLLEYPDRKSQVLILSQSKNQGVAAARQRGLESITGDYCIQFDSDDYVDSTMIAEMVNQAVRKDADIVMCDFKLISKTKTMHVHVKPDLNPIECMKQILRSEVHSSLCNKLVRVSLYRDNKIQFVEGLNMREDLGVMYRLLYFAHKLAYVSKPYYNYVLREGSISSAKMSMEQQKDAQNLISLMDDFFVNEKINDNDILDSFLMFKAQIKARILLFGNSKLLQEKLYKKIRLKHYYSHPTLPFSHKLMGIISYSKLLPLMFMYRKAVSLILILRK